MRREIILYLDDIYESISHIESFLEGVSKASFCKNVEKQSAVTRQLEIIGEAVKNLPSEFTTRYSIIPWKDIAGLRDVMIHSYHRIDYDKVWNVIQDDLPLLKKEVWKASKELRKK